MIKVLLRLSVCLILIKAIVAQFGTLTLQREGCPRFTEDFQPACGEDGHTYDWCNNVEIKCRGWCPCPTSCNQHCKRWGLDPVCGETGQLYPNWCYAECEKVKTKPCKKSSTPIPL